MEKYLGNCLDTISRQTYTNIEVICVVDGGNDSSFEISKAYSEKDNRFKAVWQENAGSGPARNNGLAHANGKYIVFVDPDDWIQEDFVERLVAEQEGKYDLVLSGCTSVIFENDVEVGKKYTNPNPRAIEGEDLKKEYLNLYDEGLLGSPTKKLYLKSIIDEYGVEFPDLRRSQDIVFNYRYYDKCKNVKVAPYMGYFYRIEPKDRLLRLKQEYYKTINLIVEDIRNLHLKWTGEIPEARIANIFVHLYIANIESDIVGNRDFSDIVNDEIARSIVAKNTVSRPDVKLISKLILDRKLGLIKAVIKARYFVKNVSKRW